MQKGEEAENLIEKIKKFETKKILVVGDLILDKYVIGDCDRISPEAPVLVLRVKKVEYNPGGAGNTAVNIKTLGSEPYLIGLVGHDKEGETFKKELKERRIEISGILSSPHIHTIKKERFVSLDKQLLRADHNDREYNDEIVKNNEHYNHILNKLESFDSDIVIISDYAKATLSEILIENIINYYKRKNKPVIVDPRPQHAMAYKNVSFVTPNFKEAYEMAPEFNIDSRDNTDKNAKKLAEYLYDKLNSSIVLTRAEKGIYFYNSSYSKQFHTFKRGVRDVSGAGDTVVAALAVGLANNLDIDELINFANHAGGVKVEKPRVQPVYLEEVVGDIKLHHNLE